MDRNINTPVHSNPQPVSHLPAESLSTLARISDERWLAARFPDHYCWYILAGMLDIMLTWVVLHLGGREVNVLAHRAIELFDVWGLVAIKIASIIVVIAICETLARVDREILAKRVVYTAIAIGFLPVAVALFQLANHTHS